MSFIIDASANAFSLLLESSVYILMGLLVAGMLRVFFDPAFVSRHLGAGSGRFKAVFKAAILGIPLPLCSCGVLPVAVSLKKQGADNAALTSFLVSTPESGADSIAATYALMDPVMTVARPLAAFITAIGAGIAEILLGRSSAQKIPAAPPDLSCPVDGCCDGIDCEPAIHKNHHSFMEKAKAGFKFAFGDVWADMAGWFFVGILFAGIVMAAVPEDFFGKYLGGGIVSMLVMLAIGIPIYICATASTPVAAAFVMMGVSPGAALVFLLSGPATNVTTLTVLTGVLGKRAAAVYLASIAFFAVALGLALDAVYAALGLSAKALSGQAGEFMPLWLKWAGLFALAGISAGPVYRALARRFSGKKPKNACAAGLPGCGCSHDSCKDKEKA
jgi:hypothetical protein